MILGKDYGADAVITAAGYPIFIGGDKFSALADFISDGGKKVMIISDSNVAPIYLAAFSHALMAKIDVRIYTCVLNSGENTKNVDAYIDIINRLAQCGFRRDDSVIALGGGVVGDIAGFAAATYMRGINFYQVPTTLLAMIDSSIGGKTGVNLSEGKNLLGAFYNPRAVFIDDNFLSTLPAEQWTNGLGEGIKYACLVGGELADCVPFAGRDSSQLKKFITLCADYKAKIVSADRLEGGERRLLNFGHTLGHAIEKKSGYSVPHGAAVAQGMLSMAYAAYLAGEVQKNDYDAVLALAGNLKISPTHYSIDDLFKYINADKKTAAGDSIYAVLYGGLGNCVVKKMPLDSLKQYLSRAISG